MATRVIKGNTISTGAITKTISSGTLDSTMCRRVGNIVTISGRIHSMSNQLANGYFCQLPEGFRPAVQTRITGCVHTNNSSVPINLVSIQVETNGQIGILYSSAYYMSQIQFFGTYPID